MNYPIEIIKKRIAKSYLKKFLDKPFKEVVKFVVDLDQQIIALGGELHSDAAEKLIRQGSDNRNLWGGNFYPLKSKKDWLEYSSLINLKPSQDNFAIDIKNQPIKKQINKIIKQLIIDEK